MTGARAGAILNGLKVAVEEQEVVLAILAICGVLVLLSAAGEPSAMKVRSKRERD